jgi:hypothetical protein
MAAINDMVRPGDIISADLFNRVITLLNEHDAILSAGVPSTGIGEPQAVGFLDVSHKGGARGIRVVPGNSNPLPQSFEILNATDQLLRIKLTATVTAPHGLWEGKAVFENGATSVFVTVPAESRINFDVLVKAPDAAVINDKATLTVMADVGAPHNKHGQGSVELTVALSEGPAVTSTLELGTLIFPADFKPIDLPSGVDGRIPRTRERSISYPFKYGTQDTSVNPGFEFSVVLSNATPSTALAQWAAMIDGAVPDEDTTNPGGTTRTFKKRNVALTPGLFKNLPLKLIAPDADTKFTLTVAMHSTSLATELQQLISPIVIESK